MNSRVTTISLMTTAKSKAVTFIELLVVIAIIACASAVLTPQFKNTFVNIELENFARDIYYFSRYLQSSAVTKREIYCLGLYGGQIKGFYAQGGGLKPLEVRFGRMFKIPRGVIVSSDKPKIYFYPDATCDDAKITFTNGSKKQIELSIKGASADIKIE